MPGTAIASKSELELRKTLQRLLDNVDGIQQSFADSLRSLIAAIDYRDKPLLVANWKVVVEHFIAGKLRETESWIAYLPELMESLENITFSSVEELGKMIEAYYNTAIKTRTELRDLVRQFDLFEPENLPDLDRDIDENLRLKDDLLKDWPWAASEWPAPDREMAARSEATYRAGDRGEDIRDVIKRLKGES